MIGMRRPTVLVAVVLAAGCSDPISGELEIELHDGRMVEFAPCDCASGEPLEFFGVDLWDHDDRFLRAVHFPIDGPALLYFEPGQSTETFRIHPEDCRHFSGELERTDTETNGVWEMRGEFDLDCTAPSGEELRGRIEFGGCADFDNDYSDDD